MAFVVANTGWDWDRVLDTMTFRRFAALRAEWRLRPPAHWLLATIVNYRPQESLPDSAPKVRGEPMLP